MLLDLENIPPFGCAKKVRKRRYRDCRRVYQTSEKMKSKLRTYFLTLCCLYDSYSQLHNLNQGTMSVEESIKKSEKLLIKCDLQVVEDQTIVKY